MEERWKSLWTKYLTDCVLSGKIGNLGDDTRDAFEAGWKTGFNDGFRTAQPYDESIIHTLTNKRQK